MENQDTATEASFARLLENLSAGVLVLDGTGGYLSGNLLALNLLDVKMEDLFEKRLGELLPPSAFTDALGQVQSGQADRLTVSLEANGRALTCSVFRPLTPLFDGPEGEMVVILEDASRFRQAEKLQMEFLQTVLHRIRGPLSSVKTSLSILTGGKAGNLPPALREVAEISRHEVNRLHALLASLRHLFLIETGMVRRELVMERFPVRQAVDRALAALEGLDASWAGAGSRFRVAGDCDTLVLADFAKLKQVLLSLFKNAAIYSAADFLIDVQIRRLPDCVSLSVRDLGIGIAEENLPQVFQKFFRENNGVNREREGSGLDLYLAKALLELMNGSIYCESRRHGGCSFTVSLPGAAR